MGGGGGFHAPASGGGGGAISTEDALHKGTGFISAPKASGASPVHAYQGADPEKWAELTEALIERFRRGGRAEVDRCFDRGIYSEPKAEAKVVRPQKPPVHEAPAESRMESPEAPDRLPDEACKTLRRYVGAIKDGSLRDGEKIATQLDAQGGRDARQVVDWMHGQTTLDTISSGLRRMTDDQLRKAIEEAAKRQAEQERQREQAMKEAMTAKPEATSGMRMR